jgi:hypothetical protein
MKRIANHTVMHKMMVDKVRTDILAAISERFADHEKWCADRLKTALFRSKGGGLSQTGPYCKMGCRENRDYGRDTLFSAA